MHSLSKNRNAILVNDLLQYERFYKLRKENDRAFSPNALQKCRKKSIVVNKIKIREDFNGKRENKGTVID